MLILIVLLINSWPDSFFNSGAYYFYFHLQLKPLEDIQEIMLKPYIDSLEYNIEMHLKSSLYDTDGKLIILKSKDEILSLFSIVLNELLISYDNPFPDRVDEFVDKIQNLLKGNLTDDDVHKKSGEQIIKRLLILFKQNINDIIRKTIQNQVQNERKEIFRKNFFRQNKCKKCCKDYKHIHIENCEIYKNLRNKNEDNLTKIQDNFTKIQNGPKFIMKEDKYVDNFDHCIYKINTYKPIDTIIWCSIECYVIVVVEINITIIFIKWVLEKKLNYEEETFCEQNLIGKLKKIEKEAIESKKNFLMS